MAHLLISLVAYIVFALGYQRLARIAAAVAPESSAARRAPFPKLNLVRCLAFLVVLLGLTVYSMLGLVDADFASFAVLAFVLVGCALLQLRLPELVSRLRARRVPSAVATVLTLLAVCILSMLALEIPSNHEIWNVSVKCLGIELGLIALLTVAVWALCQRRAFSLALTTALFAGVGLAQYFVVLFKNMPIMPSDILAIQTAAAVSAGYVYTLSTFALYGIAFAAIACAVAPFAAPLPKSATDIAAVVAAEKPAADADAATATAGDGSDDTSPAPAAEQDPAAPKRRALIGAVVNLVVAVVLGACLYTVVTSVSFVHTLSIDVDAWQPLRSYRAQGFLPTFIVNMQSIQPEQPGNYSDEFADQIRADYAKRYDEGEGASERRAASTAQFDAEKPCVVAVMNETFSDLSIFDELQVGYTGPENFKGIGDALSTGKLYVSAYGGGTCNTEFEFLTGASGGYLGAGVYPYQTYNLEGAHSLAKDFSSMGYVTTAMHPNVGTNWNRENVYEALGFDEFLTIDDFEGAERIRDMVSDRATYDRILDILSSSDDPQFVFDVTMQNHSGYLTGKLPEDMQTEYVTESVADEESVPETNEYLSLIDESDRALAEFLTELQELDRPVVVVFFGDHQPYFTGDYNDAFMDDEGIEHTQRLWQTDYVIWANYDVAGTDQTSAQDDTSTNFLGSMTCDLIGAPLTDYQKAQLAIRESMPAVNLIGYQGADRLWYWHKQESDYQSAYYDLAHLQYRMLFRNDGGNVFSVTRADATNDVDPEKVKTAE